jgi:hypothetical protein
MVNYYPQSSSASSTAAAFLQAGIPVSNPSATTNRNRTLLWISVGIILLIIGLTQTMNAPTNSLSRTPSPFRSRRQSGLKFEASEIVTAFVDTSSHVARVAECKRLLALEHSDSRQTLVSAPASGKLSRIATRPGPMLVNGMNPAHMRPTTESQEKALIGGDSTWFRDLLKTSADGIRPRALTTKLQEVIDKFLEQYPRDFKLRHAISERFPLPQQPMLMVSPGGQCWFADAQCQVCSSMLIH